jgi:hypothetical protein
MPLTLTNYRAGKATRRGVSIPQKVYPVVTAVSSAEIERCVGLKKGKRLTEFLRACRTTGKLVAPHEGRLTALVVQGKSRQRMYVFVNDVPRARGRVSRG